ncbi:MAG TPA: hypothetical protein VIW47_09765 [Nitrospiraceae bacterium]|jgi:hypothetical protein
MPLNIRWRKLGQIYAPSGDGFFKTHTTRVVPYRRTDGTIRLYFASRGADDMPYLAYIDVDPDDPSRVLRAATEPVVGLGRTGTFDDSGFAWQRRDDLAGIDRSAAGWDSEMVCYPAFYPHGERVYMFYSGNAVGKGGIGYAVTENFLT